MLTIAAMGLLAQRSSPSMAQTWQDLHAPSLGGPMACSADGTLLMSFSVDPTSPCNWNLNVSTNSGVSWLDTLDAGSTGVAASTDGSRWIVANPECGNLIYTYTRGQGFSGPTQANISSSLAAISGDGTRLAVAGVYNHPSLTELGVAVSTNSGGSWRSVLTNVGIVSLALSADGSTLIAGAGSNAVFLSTNFGITWSTNVLTPLSANSWDAVASSADGTRLFAASSNGNFAASSDGGRNWDWLQVFDKFQSIAVSADGTQIAAAAKPSMIYRSTDGGTNWTSDDLGQTNAEKTTVAVAADGSRIYAGAQYFGLYSLQVRPPAPALTLQRGATNLTLGWPFPGNNLLLQSSTNPTANVWMDVPNTAVLNLSMVQNELNVPISTQSTFFRLASYQLLQGSFQDLDFESATLVAAGSQQIQFAPAFPGWTGYSGTNAATDALYNITFLDSAGFGLQDRSTPVAWAGRDGNFFATIQAGMSLLEHQGVSSYLSQTGNIQRGVQSLTFKAQGTNFIVSLNGQTLNLVALGDNRYGANIAGFAGTTAELRFTVLPTPPPSPPINTLFLDSIQFSTRQVQ